jgi:putative ABC transport system permease protein
VAIYIALSVLMAIVVLLNLNVMFIDEKKRELIVLMINGFSGKDAKRYIYYDTIVLTAIGIILGLVLGCIMGSITVGAIEPSTATFVKDVDWLAVGIGVVGSALLALIMSLISLRRIPRFNLTDINRF